MLRFKNLFLGFCTTLSGYLYSACDECNGKIDTGPTYVNIDVLESGKTIRNLDLFAWKADIFYRIISGFSVKASVLGGAGDARFYTVSGGAGFCFPVFDCLYLFPNAGFTFGRFTSKIDVPLEIADMSFKVENVKEQFSSSGPYVGLDASWKFWEKWKLTLVFMYSWSRVHTSFTKSDIVFFDNTIDINEKFKSSTQGPSYAAILEREICPNWALSLGVGYNTSLSKEKHGLRGKGAKAGVVHYF